MATNNLQVTAKNPQFETTNSLEVKQRIRSMFKFGQQYDIYLPGSEAPAGYCNRGLNWPWASCDLKIYTDETKTAELLHIKQRNWVDAWGTFDLFDSSNGEHICTFTRKFWAGILQRTWMVTDPAGQALFQIQEDNIMKFQSGSDRVLGYFVGKCLKATKGKGNPKVINELLLKKLNK